MNIKLKDIIKICNAKLIFGDEEIICENFSKDTRSIQMNDVYVGIKGEKFDGNLMYKDAFEKGAKVCILENVNIEDNLEKNYKDKALVIVEDTIKALQQIASYKRDLYNIPVIAITGSVGKTRTKAIVASVVGTQYKVLKTQGNLNNHIGLPITILGLKDHEALVVEMGMNNLGEISVLSKIAKPNIAVITNVGTSHIGNLGSRENILKAKLEILDGLKDDGILIVNNDNDLLNNWVKQYSGNINICTYGIDNNSKIMGNNINLKENSSEFKIVDNDCIEKIIVPVGGLHFVYNAICAILVGKCLNIPLEKIKYGIQTFELTKSRMELINLKNDIIIINDCYNANYDSMKAAIEYLGKTKAKRKVALLGDMLELGEFSQQLHEKVGEEIIKNKIDVLVTVGKMGKIISKKAKNENIEVYECEENKDAIDIINKIMRNDDIILIKASNGMKFKQIVEDLVKLNS